MDLHKLVKICDKLCVILECFIKLYSDMSINKSSCPENYEMAL